MSTTLKTPISTLMVMVHFPVSNPRDLIGHFFSFTTSDLENNLMYGTFEKEPIIVYGSILSFDVHVGEDETSYFNLEISNKIIGGNIRIVGPLSNEAGKWYLPVTKDEAEIGIVKKIEGVLKFN